MVVLFDLCESCGEGDVHIVLLKEVRISEFSEVVFHTDDGFVKRAVQQCVMALAALATLQFVLLGTLANWMSRAKASVTESFFLHMIVPQVVLHGLEFVAVPDVMLPFGVAPGAKPLRSPWTCLGRLVTCGDWRIWFGCRFWPQVEVWSVGFFRSQSVVFRVIFSI